MFIVICYSVHNRTVVSVDKKETYEDAYDFLVEDAKNTYNEEIESCEINTQDVVLRIEEGKGKLDVWNGVFAWTWEIREI